MNAVQSYLKNIGKSVKYATVAYVEKNAPATKEFKETNSELFKDITASIRDYKSTIRRAKDEMENTPIYRQGSYAFENAMSDIRSGKLYNKQREDDAENDFSTFGGGDFGFELDSDFSTGNGTGGSDDTTSSEITMGEKSMLSEIHESSKRSAHRIGSTIEASTRYMVETSKMNANLIYSQNAKMSRSIDAG